MPTPPSKKNKPKSPAGRKNTYIPETVEKIIDAIAKSGGDRDGWEAVGMGKDTFYKWKREYKEFADKIAIAKREFRENLPEHQKRQARRALNDYLYRGSKETWTTRKTITSEAHGDSEENSVKTVERPPPKWAIERVLGQKMDLLEIINSLIEMGVVDSAAIQTAEGKLDTVKLDIINDLIMKRGIENEGS
jgi:hypothetical protein